MSTQTEAVPVVRYDGGSLNIRHATLSDLNAIVALENEAFSQDRISRRSFARLVGAPSAAVLVAVEGTLIAGCAVVLFRSYSRRCRLYSLAVAQAARGKGVGRALLAEMERAARERGCEAVSLEVRADNEPAVSLYRRDGYELLGETKNYYSDGATALHFIKSLGQAVLR
ncbi:GNAT family N-acetyltransferase [Mesorhizobium sp. RP14(2022)]|uniref:GNAT family N-acetyltransferase n=1 Tax=Mesorhizobium liriopis TaxID=2953882 RepID=A0ABT1C7S0_9HYPH|nr:N-acetyltransferase [Mesorhizobium liriopis]MCO6050713.1 GNAT family N-acetyltransferase [Mesorhizobium liriopis]